VAKWLLVGDVHAVEDELDDCEALIRGVQKAIIDSRPTHVVFMGDQFHNHKLLNLEVVAFWRRVLTELATMDVKLWALVGNHDMSGDGRSTNHAMMACAGIAGLRIVATPVLEDGVLLVPYQHSGDGFLSILKSYPTASTVLCHQTFDGSKYENGMYAPDGIKLEAESRAIISGHIHTPQAFANVTYVGAPRWRTLSDVGINRALVLAELAPNQAPQFLKLYDTGAWCRKMVHLVDRQDAPLEVPVLNQDWRYVVDIHGDEVFIKERRLVWVGCRIRSFKTRATTKAVSESMGISTALSTYLDGYKPRHGTELAILKGMVAQRLGIS